MSQRKTETFQSRKKDMVESHLSANFNENCLTFLIEKLVTDGQRRMADDRRPRDKIQCTPMKWRQTKLKIRICIIIGGNLRIMRRNH